MVKAQSVYPPKIFFNKFVFCISYILEKLKECGQPENLVVTDFIAQMDAAYKAADLVISRAGASSISELCLLGKPSILVPSPNVAEDHQTKNAQALTDKHAALLVTDADAPKHLISLATRTVKDKDLLKLIKDNTSKMAFGNAAETIADEVLKLAASYNQGK